MYAQTPARRARRTDGHTGGWAGGRTDRRRDRRGGRRATCFWRGTCDQPWSHAVGILASACALENALFGHDEKGNSHGNSLMKKAIRRPKKQFAMPKRQFAGTAPYRTHRKKAIRLGALPVFIILKGRITRTRLWAVGVREKTMPLLEF